MNNDSGQNGSLWMANEDAHVIAALTADDRADVCVVGAGIAGMSTAYLLLRQGRSVIVLDDGPIGGGQTGRTSAHLSFALDDRFQELERLHGEAGSRLAAESHMEAIDQIEAIVLAEGIGCDFRRLDGYLFAPPGDSGEVLEVELAAAHRAGLIDVEMVQRAPMDVFDTGRCLRFPRQAQFHPMKYLNGLARAIARMGGRIATNTHVVEVSGGSPAFVRTDAGITVSAGAIVVATNSPIGDESAVSARQTSYRTYAIAMRVPHRSVALNLYWDTLDAYHYVRLAWPSSTNVEEEPTHDWLIVGGEDHEASEEHDSDERFALLEQWTRERFPSVESVEYRWSGEVQQPDDALGFIGPDASGKENVYVITGDSGHGMTHGTLGAMLCTDLIMGRRNPWSELYDPRRASLASAS